MVAVQIISELLFFYSDLYMNMCYFALKLCIPMLVYFSNWEIETCLKNSGQTVVGSSDWYVHWTLMKCVRDCDDGSNCGKTVSTFPFVKKQERDDQAHHFSVQSFSHPRWTCK